MSEITREAPMPLSALRPANARIIFPTDGFSAPTFAADQPFPTLPPPPHFDDAPMPAVPGVPSFSVASSPGIGRHVNHDLDILVSLSAGGEHRACIGHEVDWFDIDPEIGAELTRLTLLAYGQFQQLKLYELAAHLGLFSPTPAGQAVPSADNRAGLVPEVPGEASQYDAAQTFPVERLGELCEVWHAPYYGTGIVSDVPSGDEGAPVAPPDTRPFSARGDDGLALSPFRSLRGDWTKPAHAGEAGGAAVSGPRELVAGLRAGEHATDGGVAKRGKAKRRGSPKVGRKAPAKAVTPPSQE